MNWYKFGFGYVTPKQLSLNIQHRWDDEESIELLVEAQSEKEAEKFGQEFADRFFRAMFQRSSWSSEIPSWMEMNFATWICPSEKGESTPGYFLVGIHDDRQRLVNELLLQLKMPSP